MKKAIVTITFFLIVCPVQANNLNQKLNAFVKAYNTNDQEVLNSFIKNNFIKGIDSRAETERWLQKFTIYGPIEFHSEVLNEHTRYRAFYKGKITKAWLELTIIISKKNPDKIRRIPLGTGLKPKKYEEEKFTTKTELTSHLDKYFTDLVHYDYFSGTALVTSHGKTIYEVHVGDSDSEKSKRIDQQTIFNIASITKVFTATAILQLHEQGKVDLEATLNKYVKNYPDSIASKVTIKQLLTHTSGIGRGKFDDPIYPKEKLTIDQLLTLTIAPFEVQPGEFPIYSNGAFVLLGAVIENVSGMSYYEYIQKNIFDKANMANSGFYTVEDEIENRAVGYTNYNIDSIGNFYYNLEVKKNAGIWNGYKGSPAGLSHSTITDLNNFLVALRNHELLTKEFTRLFLEPQVENPLAQEGDPTIHYGYSWEISNNSLVRCFNKDGGTWGFSSRMTYMPDKQMNIIVLSNYESIASVIADYIIDLVIHSKLNAKEF